MQAEQGAGASATGGAHTFSWGSIVEGGPLQDNEFERRLAVGANIACRLRGAVREKLGAHRMTRKSGPYQGSPAMTLHLRHLHRNRPAFLHLAGRDDMVDVIHGTMRNQPLCVSSVTGWNLC